MGRSEPIAARLTAQGLAGAPAGSPEAVVERLLAVQAQDPRGARLAVRARSEGVSAADVDRALGEDRSLLITWLNRGTLHLVTSEDYPWLHALTTPQLATAVARRLAQAGVAEAAAERAMGVIEAALAEHGPLEGPDLKERLRRADAPVAGGAFTLLMYRASMRGAVVRGPMRGRQHAYALTRDWLGQLPPVDRDAALAELARRYLRGHGPAGERDLAHWAGLPLRDARAGLAAIAAELAERPDGLVGLAGAEPPAPMPPPRLLGAFDPLLLGWASREAVTGGAAGIVTRNGIFRPIALAEGRAVATWRLAGGRVEVSPFGALSGEVAAALEADAGAVRRFLALGAS